MLDIKLVRTQPELVKQAMRNRNKDMDALIDQVIALDAERREITAAVEMGFILGNAGPEAQKIAREIGHDIGIAFQIIDDILDETSDAETMGKPVHADLENRKLTYPRFHGMQQSRERANALSERAVEACKKIGGNTDFLVALIRQMQERIS